MELSQSLLQLPASLPQFCCPLRPPQHHLAPRLCPRWPLLLAPAASKLWLRISRHSLSPGKGNVRNAALRTLSAPAWPPVS